ncbi:hypothetical protein [Thermoflavimicrobium dichotomicum]|uniref:Uncharacterized protein n=1 Tax=Thermoflavimicrobium dichotomicum TaxID=46223 RepID=A0A1I3TS39_9BACL|nr:hypothetical protein [Thermoflavimicrobium dichotomicum]SFJ73422.1 hypothetical protein SAMN05421852_11944 [Thermoflavimicrobium dichotomicum]
MKDHELEEALELLEGFRTDLEPLFPCQPNEKNANSTKQRKNWMRKTSTTIFVTLFLAGGAFTITQYSSPTFFRQLLPDLLVNKKQTQTTENTAQDLPSKKNRVSPILRDVHQPSRFTQQVHNESKASNESSADHQTASITVQKDKIITKLPSHNKSPQPAFQQKKHLPLHQRLDQFSNRTHWQPNLLQPKPKLSLPDYLPENKLLSDSNTQLPNSFTIHLKNRLHCTWTFKQPKHSIYPFTLLIEKQTGKKKHQLHLEGKLHISKGKNNQILLHIQKKQPKKKMCHPKRSFKYAPSSTI